MNMLKSVVIEWGTAFDPAWECPEVIPPRYPQRRNKITYCYTDGSSTEFNCSDEYAEATLALLMKLGLKNQRATKETDEPVVQEFDIKTA